MHAANGNGGKSGRKGYSSKSLPPVANEDPEIAFQRSIVEAMSQAARLRLQAQLVPEEWSAATVLSSELSHKGGIALCYKADLPSILQRVGFTMEPTAVLLSQDPSSLGMRGYHSEIISCNIRVLKDDGTLQVVQVERFLTQLGFGEHVLQVACGTLVHLPTCMHKCVAKFPAMFGWTADMITGSTISQILQKHLPQGSFTEIQPRLHDKTLSATFRAHSDLIDTVLKISGQDRIFYKLHDSETVRPSLDLLWLPEETNIEDALTLSATSKDTYGIALKNASANHRLALRFLDIGKLQTFAKEHSIDDFSHLGRWKLSGVPSHSGPVGALAILQDRSWDVHEIVYCNSRHCMLLPIPREIAPPCTSKLADIADNSKLKQSMQLLVSNKLKQHKLLDLPQWLHQRLPRHLQISFGRNQQPKQ